MNLNFLWFGKYVDLITNDLNDADEKNQTGRDGLDYISDVCTDLAFDYLSIKGKNGRRPNKRDYTLQFTDGRTEDEKKSLVSRCKELIEATDHWLKDNASEGLEMARNYMESVSDMAKWQLDQLSHVTQPEKKETRRSLFRSKQVFDNLDRVAMYKALIKAGLFPEGAEDERKADLFAAFLFGRHVPGTIGQKLTIAPKALKKLAYFVHELPAYLDRLEPNGYEFAAAEQWFIQNNGNAVTRESLKSSFEKMKGTNEPGIDKVIMRYFPVAKHRNTNLKI